MQSILIVDDDPATCKALKQSIALYPYKVIATETADEAIQQLREQSFDLILLDYAMPLHDGKWFMQKAKIPKKTKVLLITGYGDCDLVKSMFSLGASGYLMKPIDEEMLMHNIQFHIGPAVIHESGNTPLQPEHEQIADPAISEP